MCAFYADQQSHIWSEAMGSYRKEIRSDLDTLRQDVSNLADHLTGFLSDKSDEAAGNAKQSVQNIGEVISQTAGKSRALAREGLDGLGEMLENSVRERPFVMLMIAAGLGAFVATQLRR
jgi:ElaB/YqjD/DUF883 family membrane-anchored ribosome-binding protein